MFQSNTHHTEFVFPVRIVIKLCQQKKEIRMASLQLLNRLAKMRSGYLPFDSLEEDLPYKITSFEKHDNKNNNWGMRVRVNLEDGRYVILPTRFNYLLKNDQLKKMSKDKLYLIYKGKDESYTMLEFRNQTNIESEKNKKTVKQSKVSLKDIFDDQYEVEKGDVTDFEES